MLRRPRSPQRSPASGTTLENYRGVFANSDITHALLTTFYIAVGATVLPLLIAALAGHTFAWLDFPGRDWRRTDKAS